jgi:hypothetical protein
LRPSVIPRVALPSARPSWSTPAPGRPRSPSYPTPFTRAACADRRLTVASCLPGAPSQATSSSSRRHQNGVP